MTASGTPRRSASSRTATAAARAARSTSSAECAPRTVPERVARRRCTPNRAKNKRATLVFQQWRAPDWNRGNHDSQAGGGALHLPSKRSLSGRGGGSVPNPPLADARAPGTGPHAVGMGRRDHRRCRQRVRHRARHPRGAARPLSERARISSECRPACYGAAYCWTESDVKASNRGRHG